MLVDRLETLEVVLEAHTSDLGPDLRAYRNHAYRVVNLCLAQRSLDAEQLERITVAAAFHDLGIWTDRTFDYLSPSVRLARDWLRRTANEAWGPEISEVIVQHHKLSAYRRGRSGLVELFRRADWIDVSRGAISFGLPRARLREVFSRWPSAGFRKRLLQLALARLRTNPGSPLPMLRL